MSDKDLTGEEITALLQEVKQRVRARYPSASVAIDSGGPNPVAIPLANLLPLVHARDAAQAKVASIGSVNPRAGGPLNSLIQAVKRLVARSLGWFVRDQITYNRQILTCIEAAMEAMTELNASVTLMGAQVNRVCGYADNARVSMQATLDRLEASASALLAENRELKDMRVHWQEWRVTWERTLSTNEIQFLRSVADLQNAFSHRATLMEINMREHVKAQHADYLGALERSNLDIQKKLWADLEKVRTEYERLIHQELRLMRQRMQNPVPLPATTDPLTAVPITGASLDYQSFAARFRGSESYVRANQQRYISTFQGVGRVLDLGCGRGEFLDVMRENGIPARGIELSEESVAYCRSRGFDVERADLFEYLERLEWESEDAIFCAQVVEHIDPAKLPGMVRLCTSRLRRGGVLVFETPNPACLAIFASHFYLDPTHMRPVPLELLSFYMEEAGVGEIKVQAISPAVESFPEIALLPAAFAGRFFGALDYAVIGRKL